MSSELVKNLCNNRPLTQFVLIRTATIQSIIVHQVFPGVVTFLQQSSHKKKRYLSRFCIKPNLYTSLETLILANYTLPFSVRNHIARSIYISVYNYPVTVIDTHLRNATTKITAKFWKSKFDSKIDFVIDSKIVEFQFLKIHFCFWRSHLEELVQSHTLRWG